MSGQGDHALVRAPPAALTKPDQRATAQALRRQLELTRQRVATELDALATTLHPALRVREVVRDAVRRHPVLTLGGALLVGYGLARLLTRR